MGNPEVRKAGLKSIFWEWYKRLPFGWKIYYRFWYVLFWLLYIKPSKMRKSLTGKVWGGFQGECNKENCEHRNPMYIIPEPDENGIFICDFIKAFHGKNVLLIIKEI